MNMNIQNLMAQAKKIQSEVQKINIELENKNYIEENEVIQVEMNGKNQIIKICIKDEEILKDKEIVEDIILTTINKVLEKIKKEKEDKLGKYTGGMGGLF